MSTKPITLPPARYAAPLLLVVLAAVLSNLGLGSIPGARAATTDSVTVSAQVNSAVDVNDACTPTAGTMAISVALNAYAEGSCKVNFGASNDATVTLRATSSAGVFFTVGGASFADEGGTCANLTTEEAGLKIVSTDAGVTNTWGCAAGAGNTGLNHKGVPDTATSICATTAVGTTAGCTIGIGVREVGSDLASGTYSGTINLDVIP